MLPPEARFIRRAKHTPKWAWILYAFLAILLIAFILYQVFSVFQQAQERNRAFAAYYSSLKCTSLCPAESIIDEDRRQRRVFGASCQSTCERTYLDALSKHERSLLDAGRFPDDPAYASFVNTTRAYASCTARMMSNMSFNFFVCFQDLFFHVQKEVDLSEVHAQAYTWYAFSIEELSCNPFSIKVRRVRGSVGNLSLLFILEDSEGQRIGFSSTSVPRVEDSQHYAFTTRGLRSVSKIALFAQDTSDHRKVTHELWKECPA